jgi:imidazolonepropionase-like amidohydrolase
MFSSTSRRLTILGLSAAGALCAQLAACDHPSPRVIDADLAFIDVAVVPMTQETVLQHRTVLIKDGAIVAVEPAGDITPDADAMIVSGENRFLIPGLADMHVHLNDESAHPLSVAFGVTLARNMWGEPRNLEWRTRIESGELVGPRVVTAGRIVDGEPPIWRDSATAADGAAARKLMDEQRVEGYDFFKIYERLSLDTFDAIAAHSKQIGFAFAGHVPQAVPLEHALRSGVASLEHLTGWSSETVVPSGPSVAALDPSDALSSLASLADLADLSHRVAIGEFGWDAVYSREKTQALASLAAQMRVWHVPTLIVTKRAFTSRRQTPAQFARAEMRYVSPANQGFWKQMPDYWPKNISDDQLEALQELLSRQLQVVKALHDAGAGLLVGTDAANPYVFYGSSVHEELALFVEAGLTPYEALLAATRAPAEFLADPSFGTVETGKRADLVLLTANPLEDIAATRAIAGVVLHGRWLPRTELDAILDGIAKDYAAEAESPAPGVSH